MKRIHSLTWVGLLVRDARVEFGDGGWESDSAARGKEGGPFQEYEIAGGSEGSSGVRNFRASLMGSRYLVISVYQRYYGATSLVIRTSKLGEVQLYRLYCYDRWGYYTRAKLDEPKGCLIAEVGQPCKGIPPFNHQAVCHNPFCPLGRESTSSSITTEHAP